VPKPLVRKVKVEPPDASSSSPHTTNVAEPPRQRSVAEEAAELVEQRRAYLRSGLSLGSHVSKPAEGDRALDSAGEEPLILGIGTGGRDEFSTDEPSAITVSDSPTGIDFDVYDHAFESEIKRIRSDRKKNRARTYMTKLVGEKERDKYAGDDCMIVEAGKSLATSAYTHGSSAVSKGLSHLPGSNHAEESHSEDTSVELGAGSETFRKVVEGVSEQGSKFVDLVTSAAKDLKEKATGTRGHTE
jgi:calcium/calmodulin-dependent protein kinase kinase 2